jgi:CheY-like chemotaxis protein
MDRKNILIVDDEKDVLMVLEKGLTAEGYSVITTSNGNEAIDLAKSRRPDIIILDVLMPGMDGGEVARKLKEVPETKDIPVIFLTGMFPARKESEDFRMVAEHLLFDKPYEILKLINVIENVLLEKQISLK